METATRKSFNSSWQRHTHTHTLIHTTHAHLRPPTSSSTHYKADGQTDGQTDRPTDGQALLATPTSTHHKPQWLRSRGEQKKVVWRVGGGCGWTLKRRTSLNFQLKNENCAVADGFTKMMPILRRMFPHSSGNSEKATSKRRKLSTLQRTANTLGK